jgi:ribosomal protein L37AE/L43A
MRTRIPMMRDAKPHKKAEKEIAVKHFETCPKCKRTLVNLYPVGARWICRRCRDGAKDGDQ